MLYGDSSTGSSATGTIGLDTATIAGITMTDQAFSVVNDTDNLVVQYDAAGIFGLGFPAGRLFVPVSSRSFTHSLVCCLAKFRNRSSQLRWFNQLLRQYECWCIYHSEWSHKHNWRLSPCHAYLWSINITNHDDGCSRVSHVHGIVNQILVLYPRLMCQLQITLSRDTIDISGHGQLTLGKLPDGVDNSSLTWVPVRLYSSDEGGLRSPTFAPNEVYPL